MDLQQLRLRACRCLTCLLPADCEPQLCLGYTSYVYVPSIWHIRYIIYIIVFGISGHTDSTDASVLPYNTLHAGKIFLPPDAGGEGTMASSLRSSTLSV